MTPAARSPQGTAPHMRLAAPAPAAPDDTAAADAAATAAAAEVDIDALCQAWVHWGRSRRIFAPPSAPISLLGRLRSRGTGRSATGGPDAACSADLAAFHLAYLAQPPGLPRQVFEAHYIIGVRDIKAAAAALGIGRQHWYTLLRQFRAQVHAASHAIRAMAEDSRRALPSVRQQQHAHTTGKHAASSAQMSPVDATN